MKTYLIHSLKNQDQQDVLRMVRSAFMDHFELRNSDAVFSAAQDRDDFFFIKTTNGIMGGRVYMEPFVYQKGAELVREFGELARKFTQPFYPVVFFPRIESGQSFLEMLPNLQAFEYWILKSPAGPAVALQAVVTAQEPMAVLEQSISQSLKKGDPESSVRLSRSEIHDLIRLSLDLKGF